MEIRPHPFTKKEIELNGRKIVSYDSKTGLLILDLSQGDLEKLLGMVDGALEDSIDLTFPIPGAFSATDEQMEANGVRRIERFGQSGAPLLTMEYLMSGRRSLPHRY